MDNFEISITTGEGFYGDIITGCIVNNEIGIPSHSSRRVFKFRNQGFVVKFDDTSGTARASLQNEDEIKNFSYIAEEDKEYFAAILGQGTVDGNLYIVQELTEDIEELSPTKEQFQVFNSLKAKYNFGDISFFADYRSNIALTHKGIKIYDVGYETDMNLNQERFNDDSQLTLF
jgi:hypothetical protein